MLEVAAFFERSNTSMAQTKLLERDEIDVKYKWDLSHIYSDWTEWEKGIAIFESKMEEIAKMKGQVSKNPEGLIKVLKIQEALSILAYKVYSYPMLMVQEDMRKNEINAKLQQVTMAFRKLSSVSSWLTPEMLTVPEETMRKWIDENPELETYRFSIEDMYRTQKHVLSADQELLLSYFSAVSDTASSVYDQLTTADVKFPELELKDGSVVTVTHGVYSKIINESTVREDRKAVKEAFYPIYADRLNTIASLYKGVVDKDWAYAQARKYSSSLEAKLDGNNIPLEVYTNLVRTVKSNTKPLQRYHELRAKFLGLEGDYHSYDSGFPLVAFDKNYEYDQAVELVLESVKPLGTDYVEKYKQALLGGWIDVYENAGKSSGAFSMSVYGVHPYMLLNYNNTLDYVFTLAHEMGHSLHSMLSNENQPFDTANYTIFVAEVASTFNERLLLDYMLARVEDPKERLKLIQQTIENIIGTFYTQVMFADFELQAHQKIEQGIPLTADSLTETCKELAEQYYGDVFVDEDKFKSIFWARIPHIYGSPFYVYQYATSFTASMALYQGVFGEGLTDAKRSENLEKYLTLLKSGGNDYPIAQLKKAGVDLTQEAPVQAVIEQMEKLIVLYEKELEQFVKK